jgi:hypothetical protein
MREMLAQHSQSWHKLLGKRSAIITLQKLYWQVSRVPKQNLLYLEGSESGWRSKHQFEIRALMLWLQEELSSKHMCIKAMNTLGMTTTEVAVIHIYWGFTLRKQ